MAHRQDDTGQRYPYDRLAESDDYDEALDELRVSRKDGKPHLPTFVQNMLERLRAVGLLHRIDVETPVNVRKAKMGQEQEVWIRFDTRRDEDQGYMAVEVVDVPRSDKAILAAMVAWLAQPIDLKGLLEAQQYVLSGACANEEKRIQDSLGMDVINGLPVIGEDRTDEELVSAYKSLDRHEAVMNSLKPLQYVLPLIRYYKPDFDSRSPVEQQELVEKTCKYVNDFLQSLQKLQGFLEYGTPEQKKLVPAVKAPKRDVQAAVLCDVDGMTYPQIGERLGISIPPERLEIKYDHDTLRKKVERGRLILRQAFGEHGWREHVKKMKREKERWRSLTREERDSIVREETLAADRGYYRGSPPPAPPDAET